MESLQNLDISFNQESCFLDKYAPNKIEDIVGYKKEINIITKWLSQFNVEKEKIKLIREKEERLEIKKNKKNKKNKDTDLIADETEEKENEDYEGTFWKGKKKIGPFSCLIISGDNGCGKTSLITSILKDLNYSIKTIDFGKFKKAANVQEYIDKILYNNDVCDIIFNKPREDRVLLIDKLESLKSRLEHNCISRIIKENSVNWYLPLIFICDNKHNKFIDEITKKALEIKMYPPSNREMRIIIERVIKKDKIDIESESISNIIIHSQGDVRKMLMTLDDLKKTYKKITKDNVEEYFEIIKDKDKDFDLFSVTKKVMNTYNGIEDTLNFHDESKVDLQLMIQQNYISYVDLFHKHDKNKYKISCDIANNLAFGDIIENYIYENQNWSIHEIQGVYTCVIPSYILDKNLKKNRDIGRLNYMIDLNRTSVKMINRKNITLLKKILKNMDIKDYIYVNQIISNCIENNNIEKLKDTLKGYNLNIKTIEMLLKINKLKNNKDKDKIEKKQINNIKKYL